METDEIPTLRPEDGFLARALQIIIYFGAIVSVLYYLGVIEAVLSRVAWVMQYTVGTTAAESLNAAACIFLGQTEAAILIEPALVTMTDSEIHAVMTAGFACIAGSLFSAYISFGACPQYLLSATVMSAAVSLAVSKIVYPEVQASKQKSMKSFKFNARGHNNVLECISDGAVHSAQFVGAIAANLIVYIALLAFVNSVLSYFGSLVNYPELTFNQILAYIFFPLAYMMGASDAADPAVAMDETMKVAELMGMKTALNEFIAYQKLSEWKADGVLKGARAQTIATMYRIASFLLACFFGFSLANNGIFKCQNTIGSIHSFSVKTLDGRIPSLSAYRGDVVMVVNVASFCTYTAQYLDFSPLLQKFPGLKIVAFPCNQFLLQEPIRDDEILNALRYVRPGHGFNPTVDGLDIYGKIDVNGDEEAPLYTFLKGACPTTNTTFKRREHLFYDPIRANDIQWNFEKFLVDRSGRPRYRFLADNWNNGKAVEGYIRDLIAEQ
ncbi:hypothetical protein QR680_000135 [Steinernema hermaphroditum]|uniref:Glutathione peroxidase n=1 Tax=Steinernema hermaphroditum TaxID=289476 RepID=A0AA39LDM1_9BILA|nr:hypothetical protein QR680_000135 [Steinernema hermaphroditum]